MDEVNISFSPYRPQYDFLTSDSHFAAFVGGIGSGKTLTGTHRGIMAAFGRVGSTPIPTPNTGMVVAPTYDMINLIVVPTYEAILGYADQGGLIRQYNKSEKVIHLINGSTIVFRSTEYPDRLRGPNLSWIHMDEAALMSEDVWKVLFGRIRQGGQFGYIWLTTTPAGRNWIYKKWVQDRRETYALFRMHTFDNKSLHQDFIAELNEEYSGDFAAQELGGEFIAWTGLIYAEFNPDRHVFHDLPSVDRYQYVVAGVDWGFASPGVILVLGVDADGRMDLLHEEYEKRRGIDDWASVARQLQDTYRVSTFYCDPSKPDYISKFVDAGVNATGADNTVDTGIQEVRKKLARLDDNSTPYLRVHQSAVWTQNEFQQYQWLTRTLRGEGEITLDVPKKAKDHTMDSLRYAVMGVRDMSFIAPETSIIDYA